MYLSESSLVKLMKQSNLSFNNCPYVITWLCSPQACNNNNNKYSVATSMLVHMCIYLWLFEKYIVQLAIAMLV